MAKRPNALYLVLYSFFFILTLGTSSALYALQAATPMQISDNDITRGELARFDGFLDSHAAIAGELKKDPSLINNENYIINHPELAEFLKNHPGVREEIRENPKAFVAREQRFELSGGDISRVELRRFDNYLDQHAEVAEALQKNPKLVDNQEYLEQHPELRDFLEDHPRIRQDLKEHPVAFMNRERMFDKREGEGDTTRGELQRFDGFLDSHPAVASELKKNPSLINNENYIINHPELAEFLKNHPGVREEIRENPKAFVAREQRFESSGKDLSRVELRRFDNYLDQHTEVAEALRKNPKLVDNQEYLEQHPELRDFLEDHPRIRQDLKEHPVAFMHRENAFDRHETRAQRRKR